MKRRMKIRSPTFFAWGWKGEILWTQIRGLIQISSLLIQKMNGGLPLIYGASIEDTFFCVQWSLSCLVVKICKNVRKRKCLHRIAPETFHFLCRNGRHRGTIISVFHVVVMWPRIHIKAFHKIHSNIYSYSNVFTDVAK